MNKIKEVVNNRKFIIVIIILLMIVTLITGTYAWFTWSNNSSENTSLTMTIGKLADVTFTSGNDINTGLTPVFNYYDGNSTTFSINNRSASAEKFSYVVKLNITSIPSVLSDSNSVKYALVKNNKVVSEGSLYGTSDNDSIKVYYDTNNGGTDNFVFYIYIDGNMENDRDMINATFVGEIMVEASDGLPLTHYISNLYNSAEKSEVTNNNITYNYATQVNLMNDRLGGTTDDFDAGNIRFYGANPNNYIDIGDVYEQAIINWIKPLQGFGFPEPMIPTTEEECNTFMSCSNLVSIGLFPDINSCNSDYQYFLTFLGQESLEEFCSITPAGAPILYRIIGLFKDVELAGGIKKDLVKVVRNDSLGFYGWDVSPEGINGASGINEWSQADLMKLINPGYENEAIGGSLYWNSGSGTCYGDAYSPVGANEITPCDFTNSGLSANARNKIETVKWNLGGHDDFEVFPNQIYEYERLSNVAVPGTTCSGKLCNDTVERTQMWEGKVALAYPSDYGYAADFRSCSNTLDYYDDSTCTSANWMYNSIISRISSMASYSHLLTPTLSLAYCNWIVVVDGYLEPGTAASYENFSPVFHLRSDIVMESGKGTKTEPFVVS